MKCFLARLGHGFHMDMCSTSHNVPFILEWWCTAFFSDSVNGIRVFGDGHAHFSAFVVDYIFGKHAKTQTWTKQKHWPNRRIKLTERKKIQNKNMEYEHWPKLMFAHAQICLHAQWLHSVRSVFTLVLSRSHWLDQFCVAVKVNE